VTGVATGGLLGGTLGLLAGIGALAIPGVGPLIAAGPLLAALSGAAAGATLGGITGGLIGLGLPEIEAKRYENRIAEGNILISILAETGDQVSRAKDVLEKAGAEDISVTSIGEITSRPRA
jgi:tetrahydromethanopterin S-methyltransferase subunit C